jgi:hypothetical protein
MTRVQSLSIPQFEEEFGALYRSIFARRPLEERPFRNPEWQVLLLPYGPGSRPEDLEAIFAAATACGDSEVVIKADIIEPEEEAGVVCEATVEAFEAAQWREESLLAVVDIHFFGRSGCWGCITMPSQEGLVFLGGEGKFIQRFLESVGGEEVLRSRWLTFADEDLYLSKEELDRLLRIAGWKP